MPTATRHRRARGSLQPFPERQRRGRPEQEPRRIGVDQVGLAIESRHQQQRAGHDQPDPCAIAPRQEMKADRDRERKLDHRCHPPRRDVFHPVAEDCVGRQVQLASQRRMEIDAESTVRPVVEQRDGVEQVLQLTRSAHLPELLPPLGRHHLAVPIGRLVPGQAEVTDRRNERDQHHDQDGQRPGDAFPRRQGGTALVRVHALALSKRPAPPAQCDIVTSQINIRTTAKLY